MTNIKSFQASEVPNSHHKRVWIRKTVHELGRNILVPSPRLSVLLNHWGSILIDYEHFLTNQGSVPNDLTIQLLWKTVWINSVVSESGQGENAKG